jgi:hypothetical protein
MTQPEITPSFAAITKQAYPVRDVYEQLKVEIAQTLGDMKENLTRKNKNLDTLIEKLSSDDKTSRIHRSHYYTNTDGFAHLAARARTLETACAIIENSFAEYHENHRHTISPEIDNTYIFLNPTQDMAQGVINASDLEERKARESGRPATLNPSALRRELQPQQTEALKHAAPANDTPERELGPVEIAPGFNQGPQG